MMIKHSEALLIAAREFIASSDKMDTPFEAGSDVAAILAEYEIAKNNLRNVLEEIAK